MFNVFKAYLHIILFSFLDMLRTPVVLVASFLDLLLFLVSFGMLIPNIAEDVDDDIIVSMSKLDIYLWDRFIGERNDIL
jgi:hypothetical protein